LMRRLVPIVVQSIDNGVMIGETKSESRWPRLTMA
jgi:hypothetical protein